MRGEENGAQAHIDLLREMKERRTGSSGWFGIKAHWHTWKATLETPALAALVQPDAFIYLRRLDKIAQAASLALAEQTGWWVDESQATGTLPEYSPARIQAAVEIIEKEDEAWQRYFAAGRPCLVLTYEELIAHPDAAVSAVCSHLGVMDPGIPDPSFPSLRARPDHLIEEWAGRFRHDVQEGFNGEALWGA